MSNKTFISVEDFTKIEFVAATIISAEHFKEARHPAYMLTLDLGSGITKKSSAQITALYEPDDLIGKQVICVANLSPKQIGPIHSEVLVTGLFNETGDVVLTVPERPVQNGAKLG